LKLYDKENKGIKCLLCPHGCVLQEDAVGLCLGRIRKNDKIIPIFYGKPSGISIDPIEKKPLYHFFPGTKILSIGFLGCNLKCQFCQNYEISQTNDKVTYSLSPNELLSLMQEKNINNLAFTYNEPIINFEYIFDVFKLTKKKNYKNVLVTNGYINKEPLNEILKYTDALNIDLKFFSNESYKKYTGGYLDIVLDTIKICFEQKKHIEITTLIIPELNTDEKLIENIIKKLSEISPDIPYHLSRYFPAYKLDLPPTGIKQLEKIKQLFQKYFNYVYTGNVMNKQNTYCPYCQNLLIERDIYKTKIYNFTNVCSNCNSKLNIII